MKLADKVAVVVPGTFGVGHDTAVRFATEGARVVVGGLDEENGRKTLGAIARAGGAAHFVPTDLQKEPDLERLVDEALARYGALDIAFGCPDHYVPGLAEKTPLGEFDAALRTNARSLFFLAKHAIPRMVERGGGSLIFLTSVYALVSGGASCAYEVSKGVVVNLARSLAERYGAKRVRVNCIAAGHTIEPERDLKDEIPTYLVRTEAEIERLSRFYPAARLAVPDDIASAAVFLASDDSSFATGIVLPIDGGFVIR